MKIILWVFSLMRKQQSETTTQLETGSILLEKGGELSGKRQKAWRTNPRDQNWRDVSSFKIDMVQWLLYNFSPQPTFLFLLDYVPIGLGLIFLLDCLLWVLLNYLLGLIYLLPIIMIWMMMKRYSVSLLTVVHNWDVWGTAPKDLGLCSLHLNLIWMKRSRISSLTLMPCWNKTWRWL